MANKKSTKSKKSTSSKKNSKKEIEINLSARLIVALLFLAGGALGGFFGCKAIMKNDTFEIVGEQNATIQVGEEYNELGAKVVVFGKDISKSVVIESTIDTTQEGVYYVKYSVNHFLFKNVYRYRYVEVVEVSA